MSSSKYEAPKEKYDTQVPSFSDHKDQGFPPELHRRPDIAGGVRQQCSDASKKANIAKSKATQTEKWNAKIKR
jgi:hypothetical protein